MTRPGTKDEGLRPRPEQHAHAMLLRGVLIALICGLVPTSALAEVRNPNDAEAQVEEIRGGPGMDFCRAPRTPLSARALALCPMAEDATDCAGLKAACHAALHKKEQEKPSPIADSILHALGVLAHILVYLLVAAVLAAIAVPIVNALRKRRRDAALAEGLPAAGPHTKTPEEVAPIEHVDDAEGALRRADAHFARGDLSRATSLYLAASLAALDQRGAIRIVKSRTNGEYARACSETESRPKLRGIANEVDRVEFGGEPPTVARVEKVAALAKAVVRALPVATLMLGLVALLGVAGCNSPQHPRFDDPAGDQVFFELLKRQGFSPVPHGAPLASLRPVADGEVSPILVVDLERVPVEAEAESAIEAWVASGGVLVLFGTDNHKLAQTFKFSSGSSSSKELDARLTPLEPAAVGEDDDDEDDEQFAKRMTAARDRATVHHRGHIPRGGTVKVDGGYAIITIGQAEPYAVEAAHGKGTVVVVHDDDLTTNATLARKGNAAVVATLFTEISAQPTLTGAANERRVREARTVRLARPQDGTSPPSNPFSALSQAGLGRGMWHALAASLVLFLAYGVRHARAKPEAAPARRAFAEHVEATGAFYARSPHPAHALASFARFAEDRVRQALPRGTTDVPAFLAARSGRPLDECQALWERATKASSEDPSVSFQDDRKPSKPKDKTEKRDDLRTLADLRVIVTQALVRSDQKNRQDPT